MLLFDFLKRVGRRLLWVAPAFWYPFFERCTHMFSLYQRDTPSFVEWKKTPVEQARTTCWYSRSHFFRKYGYTLWTMTKSGFLPPNGNPRAADGFSWSVAETGNVAWSYDTDASHSNLPFLHLTLAEIPAISC